MQQEAAQILASSTRHRHNGFSLVEVLIALVVLSVGMLGVAGLYVQSMQASRTSMLRHHAVILAGDVADRIRANPRAGVAYQGSGRDNDCVSGFVNCDESAMAGHDILLWKQQAAESLPDGDVQITFDESGDLPTYLIVVIWSEPGSLTPPFYSLSIPVFPI
ncbi:MAG: type IV pilus modification protein PilV [Woeseiaceae bacterium]